MRSKIQLSPAHLTGDEAKYIVEALDDINSEEDININRFEVDLVTFLKQKVEVVALNTGTAALHLGLINLGVEPGDEVICQSFALSASSNPIAYLGAKPVFVDSEADTWNMCPEALEATIKSRAMATTQKPKVIIVVHAFGMPAKMDEILAVAKKYEIPVLEDAAEGLGSTYKGKMCGTFGQMAALSFNGNKIITTSGGGALVCQTKDQKDQTVFLSTQARDNAPHYQHSHIGYNYRMSNIVAGIGRGQMEVLADRIAARRANHAFYVELFKDIAGVTVFTEPSSDFYSNHWLSCITLDESVCGHNREQLRLALLEENIETRPLWKPMHMQPVFQDAPYYGGKVSEKLFDTGLCLPSGSNLSDEDRERIAIAVRTFFKK
ncbi:aminotransferase class I/II-fold pyridoxal phosphate-dependent enzyme [Myroides pelagicus]|uniref:DegT/DnrJ/EryC1/StrS family aminotransferase n=1 Tax=Myroides pelagicus TaxID=270914 RepID=UPI002DB8A678|nr:aminotransferase class I/II-fold pyridoxal phosphate-dependent enzyme [Myroides pelagicus]MEC4114945.1 aminotransferase class I/II-fold pyridoxal phosphate-dependent enzyme [Myroides pelagicus]